MGLPGLSRRDIGRDDHHRDSGRARITGEPAEHIEPVRIRQIQVQQQRWLMLTRKVEAKPSLASITVGDATSAVDGNSSQKVAPCPRVESTPMAPPIR